MTTERAKQAYFYKKFFNFCTSISNYLYARYINVELRYIVMLYFYF